MKEKESLYKFDNSYINEPMDLGDISLIQIGRRFCAPSERILPHTHLDWFELTIAIGGDARVGANGEYTHLTPGDIYLSHPCDIHEIEAGASGFEYDFFSFVCTDESLTCRLKDTVNISHERVFRDERVSFLVGCAIGEASSELYGREKLLCGLLSEAVVYTVRALGQMKSTAHKLSRAELTCYELMNYIDTHIYSMASLEELADYFNYNYSYLSSLFRKTTGKTLREYYADRRLEVARIMLLENNKKIWEISEMLRYSSPFAFSKAFCARYGVSPKRMQLSANQRK